MPHFPRYLIAACLGSKNYQDLYDSDVMGKYMPSIWFKMRNSKIAPLKFCIFLRQSLTKITGKTAIWTIVCFSLLLPVKNVEEQWAKLASSNVIASQHYIGRQDEF